MTAIILNLKTLFRDLLRSNLSLTLVPIILLIIIGTVGYSILEGWALLDALYATIITITTVGYGDLSPQTIPGRLFAIFFTLIAIGLAGYAISTMAAVVIEYETTRVKRILEERRMKQIAELKNHMVVCGGGVIGNRVANEFIKNKKDFIIIEPNEELLRWTLLFLHEEYIERKMSRYRDLIDIDISDLEQKTVAELADELKIVYLIDDPTEDHVLIRAGLARAEGLVVALEDDRDTLSVILSARDISRRLDNVKLRIIARVLDERHKRRFYLAGADKVTLTNFLGGFHMASHLLNPNVSEFWDQMLYFDDHFMRFYDVPMPPHSEWVGKTVADLKREKQQTVVAVKRKEEYIFGPETDFVFVENDIVIVLGPLAGKPSI